MTEITFHFNVPDRMAYACRLLRKAVRRGARVVVSAPAPQLTQLDRLLWTFEPVDFIPHVLALGTEPPAARLRQTPVWLTEAVQNAPHQDVLLNVGDGLVTGFESFARLIEVVPSDEVARREARGRWKHYADRGYTLLKHDVAQDTSA